MLGDLSSTILDKSFKLGLSLLIFLVLFIYTSFATADTIRIGLRAHIGMKKSMQQWEQTADYLSEKIPEHKFIMVPIVGIPELTEEAAQGQFDFVLTNPSSFVEMELRLGATAILTLRNKRQGRPYTKFGAVIFTRKDNDKINEIADLKHKRVVAVSKAAFGGWRVVVSELLNEGFDIYKEAMHISFTGGIQQDVVSIVSLGNADAGVVRTDMLERMAAEGVIDFDDFKILNKKTTKNFPFVHSSQLYPEWPFVKMRDTSSLLSKQVALALLTMPSNNPAAIAGKYVGWTVPEDYQPVHKLMKQLKVGPYRHHHESLFDYIFDDYLIHFIVAVFILIILTVLVLYILSINRLLAAEKTKQDKLMNNLEVRVAERTQDLLVAKNIAENASEAKSLFLSSMSHELRTPLNAVLGFAQLIELDAKERHLTEMGDNVDEIIQAGHHLLELINDVLDLSKIEEGKYELKLIPVGINKLIAETIKLLETQAKEKEITISYKTEVHEQREVLADKRSIKQVFINLISNAIKYNHANGTIDIRVVNTKDDYCKVTITDSGDGIAEEFLGVIFDPFQRVTDRTDILGTGVGLAITKNLVELMDGEIQVESILGKGSTFTILLKLVS